MMHHPSVEYSLPPELKSASSVLSFKQLLDKKLTQTKKDHRHVTFYSWPICVERSISRTTCDCSSSSRLSISNDYCYAPKAHHVTGLVCSTCSVIILLHLNRSYARFIASSKLLMFRPFNCDFKVPSNVVTGLPLGFFVYFSASLSASFAGASS